MSGPRFLSVRLRFGRHSGEWELPTDRPVLIVGPNGSGKTTFVDGLLRTLFGFNRRAPTDRELADARRPWGGSTFDSAVRVWSEDGTLDWTRDHDTDEVRVVDGDGALVYAGQANPAAGGSSHRVYRELVRRLFGVEELEAWGRTAFVSQGNLLGTSFDGSLLRLSDGGHARWNEACRRIEERHRELTRQAIGPGGRRLGRDRLLETLQAEVEEIDASLARARAAVATRASAAARLAEADEAIDRAESDLEALGALRRRLLERARLDAELADARQRFDRLIDLREDLGAARRELSRAEALRDGFGPGPAYPADFSSRAAVLRKEWAERESAARELRRLEEAAAADLLSPRVAGALAVGGALTVGGAAFGFAGASWAWALVAAALALLGYAVLDLREHVRQRRATRRELAVAREASRDVERRLAHLLEGVPDAATLGPDTLPERLDRHERARSADERRAEAKSRLADVMRRIEKASDAPGRSLPHLVADAERRLNQLEERRAELAADTPRLDGESPLSARAAEDGVARQRDELVRLRAERERLLVTVDRAVREGADAGRLEERSAELASRVEEVRRQVEALRAAHALLHDGYEEFRDRDEDRLVRAVSRRLEPLGDPALGPFRAENGLEAPTVGLRERRLSIGSSELSHGQRHLVMLAVRLGAADFLADGGPAAPLIVDEPFVHLDDRHAGQVWNLLQQVSVHRQVIVTTQESALLDRLGAEPTIRLAGERVEQEKAAVAGRRSIR